MAVSASRPTSETANGLGGRLRRIRSAQGMSVRELARRAGCSASLVSQVERISDLVRKIIV